jgi:hypothetical protein
MDHNLILQAVHEAEVGVALTVGGWILMFPVRTLLDKARVFFAGFDLRLKSIETELSVQRTNCLATLQSQGAEQVVVLKEVSQTLKDMHLEQREMSGFLKGR